jgi:hypothetical protein
MAKYHINQTTGRPNKCTATKRACPVGGQHYPSKEDAQDGIEAAAKAENNTFTTLQKPATRESSRPKYMSREDRFKELMTINLGWTTPAQLESDTTEGLREYADYENPGCGGCDGSRSDYCRCRVYTGQISVTSTQMASDFYNRYANERSYKHYSQFTDEEKQLVAEISELLEKNGISDTSGYEVESSRDYYGEELDRISVYLPEKFEELHKDLEEILKDEDDEWDEKN